MKFLCAVLIVALMLESCGGENTSSSQISSHQRDSILADSRVKASEVVVPEKITMMNFKSFMLTSDLNGDGIEDHIQYVDGGPMSGHIQIKLGGDSTWYFLKCETEDGQIIDDFSWGNEWGVIHEKRTNVTYAIDGELNDSLFTLENPAVIISQDGGGRGFFTFKGGKWIWKTTGC